MLINTLFSNPVAFLFIMGALIICISIHEFAHAYVAHKLGDDTAYLLGRVTLDPRAHLDPIGTLLLIVAGFGWGKPVPFNPYNLAHPKRDSALIAIAGPASNFILAILLAVLFRIIHSYGIGGSIGSFFQVFFYLTIMYNLVLGVFNLIPIHPLDGFKIVNGLLNHELSLQWLQMAPYGMYILLLLIITGTTDRIIGPIIDFLARILLPF